MDYLLDLLGMALVPNFEDPVALAQNHELELRQFVDQRDLAHEGFAQQVLPARIERGGSVVAAALDASHQFKRALGLSNSLPILLSRPGLLDIPRGESLEDPQHHRPVRLAQELGARGQDRNIPDPIALDQIDRVEVLGEQADQVLDPVRVLAGQGEAIQTAELVILNDCAAFHGQALLFARNN
jgi:hypothetical protein